MKSTPETCGWEIGDLDMKKLMDKKALLAGLGLAMSLSAGVAQAGSVTAYASLEIKDFTFSKVDGSAIVVGTDINVIGTTETSSTSATLGTTSDFSGLVTGLDAPLSSVSYGGNSSTGDTFGSGILLDITPGGGADATAVATTDLNPVSSGEANADLNLSVVFDFVSLTSLDAKLTFDYISDLYATVDTTAAPLVYGSEAAADTSFTVKITESTGTSVFEYSDSDSAANDIFFSTTVSAGGAYSYDSGLINLDAGKSYRMSISHSAWTSATAVPSPTAAAFGLFGLAAVGMRRRRAAKD